MLCNDFCSFAVSLPTVIASSPSVLHAWRDESGGDESPIHIVIVSCESSYRGTLSGVNNLSENVNWDNINNKQIMPRIWEDFRSQVAFADSCLPGQAVSRGSWNPKGSSKEIFTLKLFFHPEESFSHAMKIHFKKIETNEPGFFPCMRQISRQGLMLSSRVSASASTVAALKDELKRANDTLALLRNKMAVQEKNWLENFVLVLNAKKKRCRELQEQLNDFTREEREKSQKDAVKEKKKVSRRQKSRKKESPSKRKRRKVISASPERDTSSDEDVNITEDETDIIMYDKPAPTWASQPGPTLDMVHDDDADFQNILEEEGNQKAKRSGGGEERPATSSRRDLGGSPQNNDEDMHFW